MYDDRIMRTTPGRPEFPELLREIKDPPAELFYIGNIDILKENCAAVVGSRKTTQYGRDTAAAIGARLAERGITVVSGMAAGIDACAHAGALRAGGNTAAVLGCGVDVCYPRENLRLKEAIEERGVVLSEYRPGTKPERYHFPRRNRIISGLSSVTAVVQAGNSSGALITAELAAEQGRDVYSVPGNIDSRYNLGSNKLIKEGAVPIISVEDVLEPFGMSGMTKREACRALSETEMRIYDILLDHGEMTVDQICAELGKPPAYVNGIVAVMEMKGAVFSALGKIFVANR